MITANIMNLYKDIISHRVDINDIALRDYKEVNPRRAILFDLEEGQIIIRVPFGEDGYENIFINNEDEFVEFLLMKESEGYLLEVN